MADTGYRSIEVIVINDTRSDLSIQGAGDPTSGTWVDGEKPTDGTIIPQYAKKKFGVKTDDQKSAAEASFLLTGRGSLEVDFFNTAGGNADVTFTTPVAAEGKDLGIQGTKSQADTSEENHPVFVIQITPTVAKGAVTA